MTASQVPSQSGARPFTMWLAPLAAGVSAAALVFLPGDYRVATALGIVQGLGEFLPISSSAHLIIAPWLFGFQESALNTLTYDVALHLGTTIALLAFFWRDWVRLTLSATRPRTHDGKLFWMIALASIPGAAAGALLDDLASSTFRSPLLIAGTLAAMGALLYLVDHLAPQRRTLETVDGKDALVVGLAQAVALVPGVSRSGSTITFGRILGLRRDAAARFSFLMAMPITLGALLFKLKDLDPAAINGPFLLGVIVSFFIGALSIRFLLNFVNKRSNSFLPFAIYRWGLAALIVIVYLLRRG